MNAALLHHQFQASHSVLRRNLEGISHEESLRPPADGGNCLNWVLGHLVSTRNLVLDLLGQAPVMKLEQVELYPGEGADPSCFLLLEDLKIALERSQKAMNEGFEALSSEDMGSPAYGSTVEEMLAVLAFHEGYHGGQIGIIRRSLGHEGVIKPPKLPPRAS